VSKFKKGGGGGNWAYKFFCKRFLFSSNLEKKKRLILKRTNSFNDYFIKTKTLTELVLNPVTGFPK